MYTSGGVLAKGCMEPHTSNNHGTILREILDNHIPPPVLEKTVQRAGLVIFGNSVARLNNAAISTAKHLDLISALVFQEKPGGGSACHCIVISFHS
jgi:hypothetical protein